MKVTLYLFAVTAVASAGFLGEPVPRRDDILSVANLLQVIFGAFGRPSGGSSNRLSGDDTAAIVGALYGGQGHHGGYAYRGGSSGGHLSPEVTAAIVSSLYGGHAQQAHRDVKAHRVITESKISGAGTVGTHGSKVTQSVGASSGGHSTVTQTSGGSAGGYNYGGKAGGYHYGGKRL